MTFESPTPCEPDAAVIAIDDLARQRELLEMLPLPTQNPSWRANKISAVFRISCDNRPFFVPCTFPVCLCHCKALALGVLFSPVSPSTPLLDWRLCWSVVLPASSGESHLEMPGDRSLCNLTLLSAIPVACGKAGLPVWRLKSNLWAKSQNSLHWNCQSLSNTTVLEILCAAKMCLSLLITTAAVMLWSWMISSHWE